MDPKKLEELAKQEVDEVIVERYSPTGELNAIPALSISFNQPMIALSSVSDIELMDVPATLEPQVPGKWVWKGTQNLQVKLNSKKLANLIKNEITKNFSLKQHIDSQKVPTIP